MTATVDTSKAVAALESLSDATGVDMPTVIRDETRRLSKTIANFTPPLKTGQGSPQKTGEHAVERELKNLFSEATADLIDEIGSKYGTRDIHTAYITEKNGARLNLDWNALDPTGSRMAEYHKSNRGSNGKVKIIQRTSPNVWASRVVVPRGSRDPYIAKIKARVGRAKAKWALIAAKLGEKFPTYITRHFGSISDQSIANIDGLNNKEKPSVTFGSRDGTNSKIRSQVQFAVNLRAKAIANRVRLILSGYSKDVAKGIRPSPQASKTGNQPQEDVE